MPLRAETQGLLRMNININVMNINIKCLKVHNGMLLLLSYFWFVSLNCTRAYLQSIPGMPYQVRIYQTHPPSMYEVCMPSHNVQLCVYHTTPLGRFFHVRRIDSWNSVGAQKNKIGVGNVSARAFEKDVRICVSFRFVLAPSWLSSNRAWNTSLAGCDTPPPLYAGKLCNPCMYIVSWKKIDESVHANSSH